MAIDQRASSEAVTQSNSALVVSKLGEYRARIRRARRGQYLSVSALGAGIVWLLAALAYHFDLPLPGAVWLVVVLTFLLPAIALMLESSRKPSLAETAALIDRRLDNSQRLLTSVELMSKGDAAPFSEAQINTSAQILSGVQSKEVYPAETPWNLTAVGAGLFLLALSLIMLKGGGFSPFGVGALPPDQPVVSSLAAPTPDLGLPPSGLTHQPTPTPNPSQLALGNGSQQQPQSGSGSEQGSTSDQATTPKEQAAASQQAESDISRLQRALDGQSLTQAAADALKQGNTDQAAKQITDVGAQSDQVSDAAKKGLADALEQAAKDTDTNDQLKNAEEEASRALRNGDFNSVDAAMKDLADALKQTAANVVPQQQLAQSFPEQTPQAANDQQQNSISSDQQSSSQDGQSGSTDPAQPQDGKQSGDLIQDPALGGGDTGQQQGDGTGQQPGQGGGNKSESGQGDSQGGAPGEGTRVNGPKDTSTLDVPGNPFELQTQPNPGNTSPQSDPQQQHPGLTLDGGSGGSGASPVASGQAINVPGETGSIPLDRWDIIRKFFSPTP